MRPFRPWQEAAYAYAKENPTCALIMDKRLGKCQVAIHWAMYHGAKRVLTVAPLSAMGDWITEIKLEEQCPVPLHPSWCKYPEQTLVNQWELAGDNIPSKFFLINPEGTWSRSSKQPKPICTIPWDAVIIDESFILQNPKSKTNKVINETFGHIPLRCILSGEIAPGGPEDLFEQFKWCHGNFMGYTNFWKWRYEYFKPLSFGGWVPKKGQTAVIREASKKSSFTISRKDAGVGEVKYFETRYCDMPDEYWKAYREVKKHYGVGNWEGKYAIEVANMLARVCGGFPLIEKIGMDFKPSYHKLKLLKEVLTGEYRDQPAIILFRYNNELFAAKEYLAENHLTAEIIYGAIQPSERHRLKECFFKNNFRYLLMQARTAMYGINLSHADLMVRYSVPPDYNVISQSMDRIVMPGKPGKLAYIDLAVKGTVDEDLINTMRDQRVTSRSFIENYAARLKTRLFSTQEVNP